jgi:hypothetical protein
MTHKKLMIPDTFLQGGLLERNSVLEDRVAALEDNPYFFENYTGHGAQHVEEVLNKLVMLLLLALL